LQCITAVHRSKASCNACRRTPTLGIDVRRRQVAHYHVVPVAHLSAGGELWFLRRHRISHLRQHKGFAKEDTQNRGAFYAAGAESTARWHLRRKVRMLCCHTVTWGRHWILSPMNSIWRNAAVLLHIRAVVALTTLPASRSRLPRPGGRTAATAGRRCCRCAAPGLRSSRSGRNPAGTR